LLPYRLALRGSAPDNYPAIRVCAQPARRSWSAVPASAAKDGPHVSGASSAGTPRPGPRRPWTPARRGRHAEVFTVTPSPYD